MDEASPSCLITTWGTWRCIVPTVLASSILNLCINRSKVALQLANDRDGAAQLLVDHKSEDAHHSGTSVVQLNGTLLELGVLIEGVPAEVDVPVAEVADEVTGRGAVGRVLHDEKLQQTNEEEDLARSRSGDGVGSADGSEAIGERVEGISRHVDISREVESGACRDLSQECELGDAAVLDLDVTEAVEAVLVGAVEHAERVVESEGRLGAELGLEGGEAGGGLGRRCGGEGGGGGDGGGDDGGLHGGYCLEVI